MRSLRSVTLVVLVLGLLLSHAIGFWLYTLDRRAVAVSKEAFEITERASGVISLLLELPEDWRDDIVTASDSLGFRVWQSKKRALLSHAAPSKEQNLLAYLEKLLPELKERTVFASLQPSVPLELDRAIREKRLPSYDPNFPKSAAQFVVIEVELHGTSWLNLVGVIPKTTSWPILLSAYLSSVALVAAVILFETVRRITRPLTDFAQAAERLGKNLTTEPLPVSGPVEVAQAAAAFNRMQERITRLIENKTILFAAISHDLRTPITQMQLRCELIEDVELRQRLQASLQEMQSIVATFLDYAQLSHQTEKRRRVELGSLVESVCTDMTETGLNVNYADGAPIEIQCKTLAVRRAITNIINNAVEYGNHARVRLFKELDNITIRIEDDGPGMPEAELTRVLIPFYRHDPSRNRNTGGIGLGLAIAQAVAHDHGGDVTLSNRPEGGLRVDFRIPR